MTNEEQELFDLIEQQMEDDDSESYVSQMFAGNRRRRKQEYQRRTLELAIMLGATVKKCEYGYLIDFSDDRDQ